MSWHYLHQKKGVYMTSNKLKLKILMIILVLINVVLIVIYAVSMKKDNMNSRLQTYKLGNATIPGYVGVELEYDTDVVSVELIAPSGCKINNENADIYNINEEEKTITILKDTDELGEWLVSFNTRHNDNITYKFINRCSPTLRMTDIELVKVSDYYYLSFIPTMETIDNKTTIRYHVTMQSLNHGFSLDEGEIELNKTAYILFNPKDVAYNGELYTIRVLISEEDETSLSSCQSVNKTILLRLEDKNAPIETDTPAIDKEPTDIKPVD